VNVTGLSQIHNLFFVAGDSQIYVYRPSFPTQRLSAIPSLIVELPISRPGLQGYINPHRPHQVNHLVVDYLGNEEILLLSCDDGDAFAYYTREINAEVECRQEPAGSEACIHHDVPPFFNENVGASAWGLAVHREARMIAISANTHVATVFAFALTDSPHIPEVPSFTRNQNRRINLPRAANNLPCISFCNTGEDPGGRFLLACDIEGHVHLYDVHNCVLVQDFRLVDCNAHGTRACACPERGHYKHSGMQSEASESRQSLFAQRIDGF